MIQPIDETNVKLPSIGYNEETDEYEYLNKGEDNETVAKDIRVWDNDVIPLVKELKQGGYVRLFNKEKDCWTYTKNSQKENTLD
jgi:alanine dehydrogenase